jgi:hypothetical protein
MKQELSRSRYIDTLPVTTWDWCPPMDRKSL